MSSAGHRLPFTIRAAVPEDTEPVLDLLSVSLGWAIDEDFRRYFRWKHESSPLGPSPAWVAIEHDRVIGYRAFVPWKLDRAGGGLLRAARAVDVATRPEARGRGVFSALTAHAIDALRTSGTDLIFTTPNDKAGCGWVKAGASVVGRVPLAVRPRSLGGVFRMLRAQTTAQRWGEPTSVGVSAATALAAPELEQLVGSLSEPTAVRTHPSAAFLRWRYGLRRLDYRVLLAEGDLTGGLAVFRLRRRGAATEAALCELLVPGGDPATTAALVSRVARDSGADYVLRSRSGSLVDRSGSIALLGQGPRLYALPLVPGLDLASMDRWDLALGDIELL